MAYHNGETPICIFDCGANKGQYTQLCLDFFNEKSVEIHCFEPGKATYGLLKENISKRNNVILNNFGLSDKESKQKLYYDEAGSGLASIYKRQLDYFDIDYNQFETISLTTVDRYVQERFKGERKNIDLLKVDVEGNELNVLRGAKQAIGSDSIRAIQVEFGGCNIDSRVFVRDFWNLLHEKYHMYRILKDGFYKIEKYEETLECFACSNFLFIHR